MDCKYIFIHYASQKGILQLHKGRMTFIYGLVISNWDKLKKKKETKRLFPYGTAKEFC